MNAEDEFRTLTVGEKKTSFSTDWGFGDRQIGSGCGCGGGGGGAKCYSHLSFVRFERLPFVAAKHCSFNPGVTL